MPGFLTVSAMVAALHLLAVLAVCVRVLLRPNREPASRVAWLVVVLAAPVLGVVAYLLLGEVNLGRRRVARIREVEARLPRLSDAPGADAEGIRPGVPDRWEHVSRLGRSINGFEPIGGNVGRLLADSDAAIDAIASDIDAASDHVHLLFYIWLPDTNGLKVVEAMMRAAARGVACRAMADGLGSRAMIGSGHWDRMRGSGVRVASALPIGNPLLGPIRGRVDLRNHRKIVVIDDRVTYCGSQNCADPAFLVKARFAPWVDAMIRFEGPIARQNQALFASDWMSQTGEAIGELLRRPLPPPAPEPGLTAQVIGTGPTARPSAMPELFGTLMFSARRELVITTPYYVPDEAMQAALCAAARRGVPTTIVFPARNDSWVVGAASRSNYAELLEAGVRLFEYEGGLLHTKSLTVDGEVTLIGSANMDRRSFDLNFENNILFFDPELTAEVRHRQGTYLASSRPVSADEVEGWPRSRVLWNNTIAMLGPLL
jgi:cardiolipin synthase